METILQDARFGARMLIRQPGFTAAALLMLALGICANVVVFSLAQTMYFKRLPVPEADRLLTLFGTNDSGRGNLPLSLAEFRFLRAQARSVPELAAHYSNAPINLVEGGDSRELNGSVVTASFFALLRLQPALGRFFRADEDAVPGHDPVAVISYRLWQRQFDAGRGVLGRSIRLNGTLFTVVGVAPRGFDGVAEGGLATDVWMPSAMFDVGYRYCHALTDPDCRIVRLLGRLAPGATVGEAKAEVAGLSAQYAAAYPELNRHRGIAADEIRGATRELGPNEARVPLLLAAAVGVVLLIACANLAGLLLARALARSREIAIRLALGAARGRVVRQLMTEGGLLALAGGALGLCTAFWTKDLLGGFYAFNSEGQRANFGVEIDAATVLFAIGLSLVTVVAFALVPALQATRPAPLPVLKEGTTVTRRSRLPGALVVAQVASCVVLLVAATLLLRSVANIHRGPGFNPDGVVLMRLRPSLVGQTAERAAAFQREAIQRLLTIPGVTAASPALYPPLPDWGGRYPLWRPGNRPAPGVAGFTTSMNAVGPGYLRTIELPLVAGRDFDDRDRSGGPRVAIINDVIARALWPDGSALDSTLVLDGDEYSVVGIVRAAQYHSAGAGPDPLVLVDYWQMKSVGRVPIDSRTHVRVAGDARRMLPRLRREMLALDPTVPISEDRLLSEWLDYSFRSVRAAGAAVACFAALALLLSVVGLYAVVAANAAHRTREIAVRVALGASRADVRRLVLGHGLGLTAAGVGLGTAGALVAARLLAAYLYGVGERDPIALAVSAALLAVTALAASYLPAYRAMAVDPIRLLRNVE